MHFVNIFTQSDLMYELKSPKNAENAEGGSTILAYIKGALFGAFYPFLLINYLGEKKWLKTALITAAYFFTFHDRHAETYVFHAIRTHCLMFLYQKTKKCFQYEITFYCYVFILSCKHWHYQYER